MLMSQKSRLSRPLAQSRSACCAPVAQMDRALASGAKGRGFESLLARHSFRGSNPETWVTQCTGYIGNTFGPNGFSSGSNTRVSRSKYPRCVIHKAHKPDIVVHCPDADGLDR